MKPIKKQVSKKAPKDKNAYAEPKTGKDQQKTTKQWNPARVGSRHD